MQFEFATASRIVFGPGRVAELGAIVAGLGERPLLVSMGRPDWIAPALASLDAVSPPVATFVVSTEPTIDLVRDGVRLATELAADVVVAIGGGSVIDAGKAIAALTANGGDPLDYLEVVGRGEKLSRPALPVIAAPTTAGTGAEVTRNAVLRSPEHAVKASLRSPTMLPRAAIVDPLLTVGLPRAATAASGLDALTQLIEPFVSSRANPVTDGVCREGIPRSARSLRRACDDGDDVDAREDLALASLLGGLALANAGLGAAHGLAAPIGGAFPDAPHGAVCGRLLPLVMSTNVAALRLRAPRSPALGRFDELGWLLVGRQRANADDAIAFVSELAADLEVPGLRAYGLDESDVAAIVEEARRASSMKPNPIELTTDELTAILAAAL